MSELSTYGHEIWFRTSGGLPACEKLKAVDRSLAIKSRCPSEGSPQRSSMNLRTEADSSRVWFTTPGGENGEIKSMAARGPSPYISSYGGGT